MINKLLRQVFVPLGWTILIQVLLCLPGSSIPNPDAFHIPNLDKIVHIILFGGIVFFWCYYFYGKQKSPKTLKTIFFVIYVLACFNGALMEFIQRDYIPGRSFDLGDIIADMAGAGLAYGISNIKLLRTNI